MSAPFERFPLTLTPLSPIHIGSGEELDWTRAIPVGRELVVFDPMKVALPPAALGQMERAISSSRSGSDAIIALQRLFRAHERAFQSAAASRLHLSESLANKARTAFGDGARQVPNELNLARHAIVAGDGSPYVPGSSLKGALRTAEVAARDTKPPPDAPRKPRPADGRNNRGQDFWNDPSDRLLGAFHESLFARVLLSDLLPHGQVTALAAQVRNVRRRRKEGLPEKGLPVSVELIPPFLAGAFQGDIRIAGAREPRGRAAIPNLAELMKTTHRFHAGLFSYFADILQQEPRGLPAGWLTGVRQLLAEESLAAAIREGRAALVRLGKFCSAESKTVEWRNVRVRHRNGAEERVLHPYTLWLAELGAAGNLPLGWALLELAEEASQPVVEFCGRFRASPETDDEDDDGGDHRQPPPTPSPPAGPRIVTDGSPPNRSRLAMLEAQADEGRDVQGMLDNLSKQAKTWPAEDRALFARLYHEKLRGRVKGHKQSEIDQRLPKPA